MSLLDEMTVAKLKSEIERLRAERVEIVNLACGLVGKRYRELPIGEFKKEEIQGGEAVITVPDYVSDDGTSTPPVLVEFVVDQVRKEKASLVNQLRLARAEVEHWRNNHDHQVRRSRLLVERLDMPVERTVAYRVATETQERLLRELEHYKTLAQLTIGRDRKSLAFCLKESQRLLVEQIRTIAELQIKLEGPDERVVRLRGAITVAIADLSGQELPSKVIDNLFAALQEDARGEVPDDPDDAARRDASGDDGGGADGPRSDGRGDAGS